MTSTESRRETVDKQPSPPPPDFNLAEEIAEAVLANGGATVIDDTIYIDDPTCYPAILIWAQEEMLPS